MKYIVTEKDDGKQEIFLFPNAVHHDAFAEMIPYIKNQTHGNWSREHRKPVSAGFVSADNTCHGESETLSLKSRGKADTELLLKQFASTTS